MTSTGSSTHSVPARAGWRSLATLLGFIGITFLAALPGAWIDAGWYAELRRPSWAPPGWIFGPVWTALYLMIATAGWGVWKKVGWARPLGLWFIQLALNAAWTPIFFGLRQPGWAFVEIVLLWCAIVITVLAFFATVRSSGLLMLPYLGWVTFATVLNFAIWRVNS